MEEKKGIGFKIHIIIAVVMVLIVGVVIWRLNVWNKRTVTVEHNSTPGEYKSESQDYIIYRPDDQPKREPDGVKRAVVFGNYMVNNYGKDVSILNMLKEGLDWEFIDLSSDASLIARSKKVGEPGESYDEFCLYKMIEYIVADSETPAQENPPFYFLSDEGKAEFVKRWSEVDLNKADYVIIMYSLMDYYYGHTAQDERNESDSVFGSLFQSITLLKNKYPHLEIILVSGYPEYADQPDGKREYAYTTDYGFGTMSKYADLEQFAAMSTNVTYIDSFYCGINEDNIEKYVDKMNLTDEGIKLVGGHVLEKLKLLD